jgi:hypothetical protein
MDNQPLMSESGKMLQTLFTLMQICESGYGGVMPDGGIVDRRKHPEAQAIPENKMLRVPAPAPVERRKDRMERNFSHRRLGGGRILHG